MAWKVTGSSKVVMGHPASLRLGRGPRRSLRVNGEIRRAQRAWMFRASQAPGV